MSVGSDASFSFTENVIQPRWAPDEVAQFISHLALENNVAASTQNQAFNALIFLYRQVLQIDLGTIVGAIRAKKPKRLPVVLTREEVEAVLALLNGGAWLVCSLLYGAGLRLFEALELRVKDIDFARSELLLTTEKARRIVSRCCQRRSSHALRQHLEMVRRQHDWDLARDWGEYPCQEPWPASTPTPTGSGAGSGCSPPARTSSIGKREFDIGSIYTSLSYRRPFARRHARQTSANT